MKPENFSIMPAQTGDRAQDESPAILFTSEHFKRRYLAAQNAGLDYLAGSILVLWYKSFPEDFEGDVEPNPYRAEEPHEKFEHQF